MVKHLSRESKRYEDLPDRVLQKIMKHQVSSERLIAVIRLAVVLIFSVMHFLSPKAFSAETAFVLVPWILGGYLLFALLHIYVSYRHLLPDWFSYLSIVVDMALIYVLIWSFHLQYAQPPSFYLKAPTLLYVFIFIALQVLRFEVRFVIAAGACAVIGWLLMIAYVVYFNPYNSMITKDYVFYLTSNSVLLSAEFDKIIAMIIVSVVLAASVYRVRKLLIHSVTEANADGDLKQVDEVVK